MCKPGDARKTRPQEVRVRVRVSFRVRLGLGLGVRAWVGLRVIGLG